MSTLPPGTSRALPTIAWAGLIAGILDITSAFIIWGMKGVGPNRLLQGIAAGLLGRDSFNGGLATAGLGLAVHFLIAFVAATLFYAASRKIRFLTQQAVASGLAYGVAVYLFMNCVVLPLASIRPQYSVASVVTQLFVHMLLVGLPIALVVRRSAPFRSPNL